MPATQALVWFRRDLRLADHAALSSALRSADRVHCAFVFDTDILDPLVERHDRRVEFILECVRRLKADLEARGATLHVLHGPAHRMIPALAARLGADAVHANRDYAPDARARDERVAAALRDDGRALFLHKDQVIFETDELLTAAGTPFRVFTAYKRAWLGRLDPDRLLPHDCQPHLHRIAGSAPAPLPGLEALGFLETDLASLPITPGEAGARERLDDFLARIDRYQELRDFPARKGPSYLSVHLRFGTISVRELVREAWVRRNPGAETWLSELIWREFYQMLLWHHPETVAHTFLPQFDTLPYPNPPGHYEAWCTARTGYPIVDAAMRQLEETGYMHNRLRMIAASFLVKDLQVDWRLGERHFAAKLLDYDQAANVGGWQWCASVGTDAQPWFRIFNPVTQSERFDPDGRFIRRYLPELGQVPDKYLHAPWKMPEAIQAACGVRIGHESPPPIVDHAHAREATLALYRAATRQ